MSLTPRFLTPLRVEQVAPDLWMTLSESVYQSAVLGARIIIPAGFVTDFASTPRVPVAFLIAGGCGHHAAVVHDFLYVSHVTTRAIADAVFGEALGVVGVASWRAALMVTAVRVFGQSAWDAHVQRVAALNPGLEPTQFA